MFLQILLCHQHQSICWGILLEATLLAATTLSSIYLVDLRFRRISRTTAWPGSPAQPLLPWMMRPLTTSPAPIPEPSANHERTNEMELIITMFCFPFPVPTQHSAAHAALASFSRMVWVSAKINSTYTNSGPILNQLRKRDMIPCREVRCLNNDSILKSEVL